MASVQGGGTVGTGNYLGGHGLSHAAGRLRGGARRIAVATAAGVGEGFRDTRLRNVVPRTRAVPFFAYVTAVAVCAAASVGASIAGQSSILPDPSAAFWVIAALAVVVDTRPFTAPGAGATNAVFPSITFTYALLLGWGLAPAAVVQALAVIVVAVRLHHAPWRAVFNASQYAVTLAAVGLVHSAIGPELSPGGQMGLAGAAAILVGACVWYAVNDVLVATAVWLRFGGSWLRFVMVVSRRNALATFALLALAPLVVAAGSVSPALVPLMLVPLYAVNEVGKSMAEQQRSSVTDELTGLPNRTALHAEMRAQARAHAERTSRIPGDPRRMALLLLDIDQFRRVNEALGHGVGDRLLNAVADRLRHCIGADGFVARLGGDEFAVLAPRLADDSAAGVLADRVADALSEPVTLGGLALDVTAAIGVALHPDHGTDNTTLMRHAEVAMYDAKDRGATYAIYAPESDRSSPDRLELLADLRRAIELGRPDELRLYYQPQVDLTSGEVVGLEALLRWRHPRRGLISPEYAIKIAEHTAVMRLLTQRVLEDAIGQLAKWRAQGLVLRVSINVSVRDLHNPDLVDRIAALLTEAAVPANQVQLEITEGALMSDPRRVLVTLHRLDRLGIALSLDDFGTGYSSLQHLRRLPLAEVKIDRSFVLGMTTDPDDAAVVRSIIDLAHALGLRVVAEGVEDNNARRALVAIGCEVAQGWFYARPMPADDLVSWLARYRPGELPTSGLDP
jgi:diguanylate cyclase (GGDEF)-like protein